LLEWLCGSLGLPLIEEQPEGGIGLNGAAREMLGTGDFPTIVAALGPLVGETVDMSALESSLAQARRGESNELALVDGLRALVSPAPRSPGLACVVFAPQGALDAVALQRRALASDRSARVSHELANALGAIAGWARLAREGVRVDEALELIERSADNAWSAARTVLGEVSGQTSMSSRPQVMNLSEFIDETARLIIPKALKKNITVHTQITPGLYVAGDRSSAWALVWNLATNAIEALPSGGELRLELASHGDHVSFSVNDNGPGMTTEVRARVFEPYFTTKASGTGLGLALVKQAVLALGGHIELESQVGEGTSFLVELPRSNGALSEPPPKRPSVSLRTTGVFMSESLEGRFLIIDDDAALREMIATALEMRGAEVCPAASLNEALKLEGPFRLAVIDFLLGDQRGDVAIARLREEGMIDRALLVTGTDVPRKLVAGGEPDAVLRKPFELDELFERVSELLERDAGRRSAAG
jgi:two-component system cell cycle sensor histidine kinase/response regulator CckA